MYHALFQLPDDVLEELRTLSQQLDLSAPGGSHMTDYAKTSAVYEKSRLKSVFYPKGWSQTTVITLNPSQQIVAHRDPPVKGQRLHIPLRLNPGCWVYHVGEWQRLVEGKVYVMDPAQEHGAVNWGATPRHHLIVDLV